MRASIAIFEGKEIPAEPNRDTKPIVPDEVFEAANRVVKSQGCELVKTRSGMFVVAYSETGPFQTKVSDEWLPVYVCRIRKWDSGGITVSEMQWHKESEEDV